MEPRYIKLKVSEKIKLISLNTFSIEIKVQIINPNLNISNIY